MNQNTDKTPTNTGATPDSKTKLILIGMVVTLIIAAVLYGVGFSKGRAELASQKARYDTQIQTLQSQLDASRRELTSSQDQTRLISARASLYRTALDLEQRNFGIANAHLQESASKLAQVGKDSGLEMRELETLQKAIDTTDINVAVDLESQRKQILDFASRLETLMPEATAPVDN